MIPARSFARSFDYVVVGAGSAGCVLANRLSADPACSVLLLEAGGAARNPLFRLPMLMGKLFHSGLYDWGYRTEPVPGLNGRSLYWPRGKVLGGSSTINGMIYVRGNRRDYDRWAQAGLAGWSWDEVLPAFRRSERHVERDGAWHGTGGYSHTELICNRLLYVKSASFPGPSSFPSLAVTKICIGPGVEVEPDTTEVYVFP